MPVEEESWWSPAGGLKEDLSEEVSLRLEADTREGARLGEQQENQSEMPQRPMTKPLRRKMWRTWMDSGHRGAGPKGSSPGRTACWPQSALRCQLTSTKEKGKTGESKVRWSRKRKSWKTGHLRHWGEELGRLGTDAKTSYKKEVFTWGNVSGQGCQWTELQPEGVLTNLFQLLWQSFFLICDAFLKMGLQIKCREAKSVSVTMSASQA